MRATAPCLLLLPLVLLAGCGGGSKDATTSAPSAPAASDATAVGTPSAQTSVAPVPSASASPAVVAKPTGAVKKFATAKLPTTIDGYTGVVTPQGPGQTGQYTGANPDDMLQVQLNPMAATGALTRLSNVTTVGQAQCGTASDGSGLVTCVVALEGGQMLVQGTDQSTVETLGKATNALYGALA